MYEEDWRLPVPYSDLDSYISRSNYDMKTIQNDHGVGFELRGKLSKATHFTRSDRGLVHYSMNSASIQQMNKMILTSFHRGSPSFFNEIIISEKFCLFFDCDSKPIKKTGVYFARLIIQGLLHKVIQNADFPDFTDIAVLKCIILDSCNAEKTSFHFRFPDMQVSQQDALSIVTLVKGFIKDVDVSRSIDLIPVSRNLVQLRMPFCDKPPGGRPLILLGTLSYRDILRSPDNAGIATNADVLRLCSLHANGLAKIEICSTYTGCKKHYSGVFRFSKKMVLGDDGANSREDIADLNNISEEEYLEWVHMATNQICTP
jgi:hypothetical protein